MYAKTVWILTVDIQVVVRHCKCSRWRFQKLDDNSKPSEPKKSKTDKKTVWKCFFFAITVYVISNFISSQHIAKIFMWSVLEPMVIMFAEYRRSARKRRWRNEAVARQHSIEPSAADQRTRRPSPTTQRHDASTNAGVATAYEDNHWTGSRWGGMHWVFRHQIMSVSCYMCAFSSSLHGDGWLRRTN